MRFQQYLTEKLKPSVFREYVKAWKETGADKMFKKVFGKKYRLYEPYKGGPITKTYKGDVEKRIEDVLMGIGDGWEIVDYGKGIAKAHGRERKIGKILQNAIDKRKTNNLNTDFLNGALEAFINDKNRALAKSSNLLICYSRHAYDITGMSTDRGWTSCMTLPGDKKKPEGVCNWRLVGNEAKEGCVIAYLIREDDKNIEHPIGRVMIKPYAHVVDYDLMWVVGSSGYGTTTDDFMKQVQEWVDKNLNGDIDGGLYALAPGMETSDFPEVRYGKNTIVYRKWEDALEGYETFIKGEDVSHENELGYNSGEFIVNGKWLFDLERIIHDLEGIDGRKIVKDLVTLAEKDEWGAEEFLDKIVRIFSNNQEYDILSTFKAVGLAIKLINKDFERDNWNETSHWINDTINKRHLMKYGDSYFLPRSDVEMAEMLSYIKPYIDRLYKVYG